MNRRQQHAIEYLPEENRFLRARSSLAWTRPLLDLKTSRVISQFHRRHRSVEFRRFLDVIEAQVPADLDVHLILDNCGTHKIAIIRHWLAKRPRFHVHFTPTYGPWLNLVE